MVNGLFALASLGFATFSHVSAQSDTCSNANGYYPTDTWDAFEDTGLGFGENAVDYCECGGWYYYANTRKTVPADGLSSPAVLGFYVDSNPSSGTTPNKYFGECTQGLRVFDSGTYFFSKEVLKRSVKDNGDCKVMLGEACVNALEEQYRHEAVEWVRKGACPGTGGVALNKKVPEECRGLIGGKDEWLESEGKEMLWSSAGEMHTTIDATREANNCGEPESRHELSGENAYAIGSVAVSRTHTIAFPVPVIFTFWPNSTRARNDLANGDFDWRRTTAMVRCMKSGANMNVPAKDADDLLKEIPDGASVPIKVADGWEIEKPTSTSTSETHWPTEPPLGNGSYPSYGNATGTGVVMPRVSPSKEERGLGVSGKGSVKRVDGLVGAGLAIAAAFAVFV